MKLQITQANDGIIIVDVIITLNAPPNTTTVTPTQIPINLDKIDFELQDGTYRITDIGNSSLTPTVKTNVTGFHFDEAAETIQVIGSDGRTAVYTALTNNRLVQVRVNFNTASITVYE